MNPEDGAAFYGRMREGALPRTSQITPYEFIGFWSELLEKFSLPIVHIAMGSGISGTYSNAVIARGLFLDAHPDARVFVLDSTLASIGYGIRVRFCRQSARRGGNPRSMCGEA
jgi:fatty acid-binding protein DegV